MSKNKIKSGSDNRTGPLIEYYFKYALSPQMAYFSLNAE